MLDIDPLFVLRFLPIGQLLNADAGIQAIGSTSLVEKYQTHFTCTSLLIEG